MTKTLRLGITALFISAATICSASDIYYGKGYTLIEGSTPVSDDLQTVIFRQISNGVNLEAALHELLQGTGWRLAAPHAADPSIFRLYRQPLPNKKALVGPMPLDKALTWYAGKAWQLVVDRVNKLVSFELREDYQPKPDSHIVREVVSEQNDMGNVTSQSIPTIRIAVAENTVSSPLFEHFAAQGVNQ